MSDDPTLLPPPSYTRERADAVLGEAFRRMAEYVKGARIPGHFVEFGTFRGYTARWMATLMTELGLKGELWLYDSFEGLPEHASEVDRTSYEIAQHRVWKPGSMKLEAGIETRIAASLGGVLGEGRVRVVKGFFDRTLQATPPPGPIALLHVDCDLYASAKVVLDHAFERGLVQDGGLLVFDDWNCNRASPRMGERRALAEALAAHPRWEVDPWFSYGWHGQAFFLHDREANR